MSLRTDTSPRDQTRPLREKGGPLIGEPKSLDIQRHPIPNRPIQHTARPPATMPPRKSEAAKAPVVTGDEATPSKDLPLREGINIEVLLPVHAMPMRGIEADGA